MPDPGRHVARAGPHGLKSAEERITAAGIHRISLPTPWAVGRVNVYLIDDDPLTLVDAGPYCEAALEALEEALRSLGRSTGELERIVITHQHLDHAGAAQALVDRSGAELCALHGLADWYGAYPKSIEAEDLLGTRVLSRHGVSSEALAPISAHNAAAHEYGSAASVTTRLADGEVLPFASRELRVLHRPGHSPSDTLLFDSDRGLLLAGDVLLADVPTSALISPPLDGSEVNVRPRAFAQYLDSLLQLQAMDVELVLPGHGEPFGGPAKLISDRIARYETTTERIASLLDGKPRTAWQIALEFRGDFPAVSGFFVLCEVLGHLDRLLDTGIAAESDEPVKRFVRAVP